MYNTQRRVGGARTLWQHMEWWCPTNALTPRRWKLSCVFFLLVRSMSLVVVWFVVSEPFYFSFFFFSSPDNYNLTFFFIGMLTSVFILLIYNFLSLFFFVEFYLFSISSFNPNLLNIIFSNLVLIILILIFFLCPFENILLVFNFIFQFKLTILYFSIWSSLF